MRHYCRATSGSGAIGRTLDATAIVSRRVLRAFCSVLFSLFGPFATKVDGMVFGMDAASLSTVARRARTLSRHEVKVMVFYGNRVPSSVPNAPFQTMVCTVSGRVCLRRHRRGPYHPCSLPGLGVWGSLPAGSRIVAVELRTSLTCCGTPGLVGSSSTFFVRDEVAEDRRRHMEVSYAPSNLLIFLRIGNVGATSPTTNQPATSRLWLRSLDHPCDTTCQTTTTSHRPIEATVWVFSQAATKVPRGRRERDVPWPSEEHGGGYRDIIDTYSMAEHSTRMPKSATRSL